MTSDDTPSIPHRPLRRIVNRFLSAAACFLLLCPDSAYSSPDSDPQPLRIHTAIAPLAYCIEQIGGEHVTVETLLPDGQDPHLFEPGPRLLHRLFGAHMYLMAGLPFERIVVEKLSASNASLSVIDMSTMVTLLDSDHDHHVCAGHHGEDHHHGAYDPHFWLGPQQLRLFITAATRIIREADPKNASDYERNAAALLARLDAVHARNTGVLAPYRNRIIFVYHPAFGYFAHAYGLQQQAVETDGRQPGARHMALLIRQVRAAGVRTVFVQPQFDTRSAQVIASAINGTVVPLDPLAKDVIGNLEKIAREIERSFTQEAGQQ